MSAAISEFMRDLGVNPRALAAFRVKPLEAMERAGLTSEETAAIASKNPVSINLTAAKSLGVNLELADEIHVTIVVIAADITGVASMAAGSDLSGRDVTQCRAAH